jgi:hypothetical protein
MAFRESITKFPELTELAQLIKHEIQQAKRPADEVIYDDVDLRTFLKVCKRTTASWREKGMITFSKLGGRIYYKLSDILDFLRKHEIPSVDKNLKLGL